jgi:hypothetical protein
MTKPDPELLTKAGSCCPQCSKSMITTDVSNGPEGSERRTFECRPCGFREVRIIASDPMRSSVVESLEGNLDRAATHEVREGRMIPKPG